MGSPTLPDGLTFEAFPKISRLNRQTVITEKIDGTNAAVGIDDAPPPGYGDEEVVGRGIVINRSGDGEDWDPVFVYAQSRKRLISPENDNFGFARWVREHARELAAGLGPGLHFGEWWGHGIQRGYGLTEKRFSLFNTSRWGDDDVRPDCCHVVPVLDTLDRVDTSRIMGILGHLDHCGSIAAPGFKPAEGIVVYHAHSNGLFKVTIDDDHKGAHGA